MTKEVTMKRKIFCIIAIIGLMLFCGLSFAQVPGKHLSFNANRYWANSGVFVTDNAIESTGTSNGLTLTYTHGVSFSLSTNSSGNLVLSGGVVKHAYDAAAYYTITQADAAGVTFDSTSDGTAGFTFADPVSIASALYFSGTPQTLSGAGEVNVTTSITWIVTTGADALTLADGVEGQIKIIVMKTDGGDGTLTPAHKAGYSTVTFNDVGDSVQLIFTNGAWHIIGNNGATIA